MARSLERSVRFTKPGSYILNMLLFLLLVGAVVFYLSPYSPEPSTLLVDAFNANIALNGLILGVLLTGGDLQSTSGWRRFTGRSLGGKLSRDGRPEPRAPAPPAEPHQCHGQTPAGRGPTGGPAVTGIDACDAGFNRYQDG